MERLSMAYRKRSKDSQMKGNVPNNKKDAEIFLNAKKIQLLELAAKIQNAEIETITQVSGFIWNDIEQIDEAIEDGCYE